MTDDLNEDAIVDALITLRANPLPKAEHIVVTDAGLALWVHRYKTEPAFRGAVRAVARRDPEYAAFVAKVLSEAEDKP